MNKTITTLNNLTKITIDITIGELVDRITILEVKRENIKDMDKIRHIEKDLVALSLVLGSIRYYDGRRMVHVEVPDVLRYQLYDINADLWDTLDAQRKAVSTPGLSGIFIDLSLKVFELNDKRFKVKSEISAIVDSTAPMEQKEYV